MFGVNTTLLAPKHQNKPNKNINYDDIFIRACDENAEGLIIVNLLLLTLFFIYKNK